MSTREDRVPSGNYIRDTIRAAPQLWWENALQKFVPGAYYAYRSGVNKLRDMLPREQPNPFRAIAELSGIGPLMRGESSGLDMLEAPVMAAMGPVSRRAGDAAERIVAAAPRATRVYHGTRATEPFERFNMRSESVNDWGIGGEQATTRHGAFFTDKPEFARAFGEVGEYDISPRRIADLDSRELLDEFTDTLDPFEERDLWMLAKYQRKPWVFFENELGERFTRWLKDRGYDAARFTEETKNGDDFIEGVTTVMLDPDRIRRRGRR